MYELAIRAKNYKCFSNETGFDCILRVNLIIGKNNAGKSSLLDLIQTVVSGKYVYEQSTWRGNQSPEITFEAVVTEDIVNEVFSSSTRGGVVRGNHGEYGRNYVGKVLKWNKVGSSHRNSSLVDCNDEEMTPRLSASGEYAQSLPNSMPIGLEGKSFRRLLAERDITPEPADSQNIDIGKNGSGLTNAIQNFINRSSLPSDLVERSVLDGLNTIFVHDAVFTDIVCQLHEDNRWEIYLEEEHKGRVALSLSGSGLKTVMSVLACLLLVPHLEKKLLSQYVFGFEELENNIHPALLRRLNDYIYQSAIDNDFIYFVTTHSNVLKDQFSKQSDAQIIHVTNTNSVATCNTVSTYIQNNGILDDLDVRASDLLQANGVIWVEGPSDRIYLNRWIELWSEGFLKEGTHYQIIFYGGRLLSHLSAEAREDVDSGISILNTNRNAIMLIDSDKRTEQAPINSTKIRIKEEFDRMNAFCWVTMGKEIENYISATIVDEYWEVESSEQVGCYESFFSYLDDVVAGEGGRYGAKKPLLAEKLAPLMSIENMSTILDLHENMERVCTEIRTWNS